MTTRRRRGRELARALIREARAENVTFMAGSIAYHAFVSLLPLLLLVLTVTSVVGDRTLEESVITVAGAILTTGARDLLVAELRAARQSAGVSLLGIAVLLWGTLRIFRGLDTAFSDIYETEAANTVLDQVTDGLLVLATVAVAIVVGGVIEARVPTTGAGPLDWLLARGVVVVGLSLSFFPMYYVFPDVDVGVREVLPGTVFAAVGLAAAEWLFSLYVAVSSQSPEKNIVAGVVVLLTWLYFSGLVVLLGVVINAVLANRSRDVAVDPVFGDEGRGRPPAAIPRGELVAAVEGARALLEAHDEVVLRADGEEVRLPRPTHVVADTDASLLFAESRPVSIELQWTPRPAEEAD